MKIISNSVEYHVELKGEGKPLLLLHGFTGSLETWSSLVQKYESRYQFIMVDLIGHGKTDSPHDYTRYTTEKAAEDLKNILETLGIKKACLLGYSLGGRLALSFACIYPEYVDRLVLESASPGLLTEKERKIRRESDRQLAERITRNGVADFIEYWQGIPLFKTQQSLPEDKRQEMRRQRLSNSETGLAGSLLGMGTGSQPSWWDHLQNLQFPVMLVTGEFDEKFCTIARQMQKLINNCEWKIIKGAGHAIHVEVDEKFGKIVSEFLTND
ncbi:2-succinyl-6-hydroxy-2,4-cyclohexadiene-1-carboxylate synthase [Peribacillus glennii]|uniref:Putative 2-succinyl-6-hydroxy-2,4-cyclohexadiene-1-carboxylate synthase n=1 Tax=Peribacillus glennii TaxID=2303991 RepID=A0A372LIU5_9BACI|nr:2-succinyl-6-hydroxy-2,4-cyclohexadiene-1-carboxylate synthase [Peribacillus glennii]RFU66305.1 2-succinyl-6-hydroxy-2,4-cyclohexadiene-1-carboxylate synthase [Peribacillus glennii]